MKKSDVSSGDQKKEHEETNKLIILCEVKDKYINVIIRRKWRKRLYVVKHFRLL